MRLMRLTKLFAEFFESEKAAGFILIACTVFSLWISNTPAGSGYLHFWQTPVADHTLVHWINDGLMTLFFLMIGLELERELYIGELSDIRNALLPVFAAMGGMLVPAAIFFILNAGTDTQNGTGIPMATDIAFSIGILSLLGKRVPAALKVFLIALAVIDDLGAILIIAFFYSKGVDSVNLFIALGFFMAMGILNRLRVLVFWPYLIGGIAMWYFMLHSGVHATIAGVLWAFVLPFGKGDHKSISYRLQHFLHKPVSFFILPVFALANTSILIQGEWKANLFLPGSLGILFGLVIGKPLGVIGFSLLAVKTKLSSLPQDIRWGHLLGAGMLAGIGFTMSIFITLLAYNDEIKINDAKLAILIASVISAVAGLVWLGLSLRKVPKIQEL